MRRERDVFVLKKVERRSFGPAQITIRKPKQNRSHSEDDCERQSGIADMMKFYQSLACYPSKLDLRSQLRRTTRAAAAAGVWFPEGVPPH
ncbi:hypothetical protein V2G26_008896 [Clonostachys chloroleuca]